MRHSKVIYSYVVAVAIACVLGMPLDIRKVPASTNIAGSSSLPVVDPLSTGISSATPVNDPPASSISGPPVTAVPPLTTSAVGSGTSTTLSEPTGTAIGSDPSTISPPGSFPTGTVNGSDPSTTSGSGPLPTGIGGPIIPHNGTIPSNSTGNSTVPAPRFVIYNDKSINGTGGIPTADQLKGYNVLALSFWHAAGPSEQAQIWSNMAVADRAKIKAEYKQANISLIVSAFGETDTPTTNGTNATTAALSLATFVKANNLDGADVDYEDLAAMNKGDGAAEAWLIEFTQTLRAQLPQKQYVITHAPVAPWFSPETYKGGGYAKVNEDAGSLIDWYNVQFYNQGKTEYIDCLGLLNHSSSTSPNSSVFEIAKSGVPLDKIVIGKPATASDATNGVMDPVALSQCVSQAKASGWNGGVMFWEFSSNSSSLVATVRGSAFGMNGTSTNGTSTNGTTTSNSTALPPSTATSTSLGADPTDPISGSPPTSTGIEFSSTESNPGPFPTSTGLSSSPITSTIPIPTVTTSKSSRPSGSTSGSLSASTGLGANPTDSASEGTPLPTSTVLVSSIPATNPTATTIRDPESTVSNTKSTVPASSSDLLSTSADPLHTNTPVDPVSSSVGPSVTALANRKRMQRKVRA